MAAVALACTRVHTHCLFVKPRMCLQTGLLKINMNLISIYERNESLVLVCFKEKTPDFNEPLAEKDDAMNM